MKTALTSLASIFAAGLVISGVSVMADSVTGTARGGATDLIRGSNLTSAQNSVVAPVTGGSHSKCCKTTFGSQTVADGKMGQTRTVSVERHACPSCQTSLQTTGHGKGKMTVASHSCKESTQAGGSCCPK